jgi:sec-independent protein translocase protein TatA
MSIGIWELMLILAIVLLLFGAGKITRVMGEVGKGINAFKDGLKGDGAAKTIAPGTAEDKTPKA